MSLLEVRDLEYRYDRGDFRLALPGLAIGAGETVACVGPSGAGKTTLLLLLAGILLPRRGHVRLRGDDWAALPDAERRARRIASIGLVFQEFELLDHLTVRENILLPYFVNRALALDDAAERSLGALAGAAGLAGKLRRRPRELSHGERQRVAVCRALVTGPGIVLADEPTGNLDGETAARVVDLLFDGARRREAAVFMVTHDPALLDRFDRVVEIAA